MPLLALKLVVTPLLIGAASLAARRWGPAVGGWLVAFPLTAGPVAFFLALEIGTTFAAAVAVGALAADIALAGYALAYGWSAVAGAGWAAALLVGSIVYVGLALSLQVALPLPVTPLLVAVCATLALTLVLLPSSAERDEDVELPRWDIPLRMMVGTAVVLVLTAIAPTLGPHLSGLAATFPVYASVLAVFTHHHEGARQAVGVQRGLVAGLFGTAAFWTVVAVGLPRGGLGAVFVGAILAAVVVQAVVLWRLRTGNRPIHR